MTTRSVSIMQKFDKHLGFALALALTLKAAECHSTIKSKVREAITLETSGVQSRPISHSQEIKGQEERVFAVVEQMPEFPGGKSPLNKFIDRNLIHPKNLTKLIGKVFTSFVVNTDGSIQDATVTYSLREDYDEAALRLINSMPKWNPGRQSGRKVRVKYALAIEFK